MREGKSVESRHVCDCHGFVGPGLGPDYYSFKKVPLLDAQIASDFRCNPLAKLHRESLRKHRGVQEFGIRQKGRVHRGLRKLDIGHHQRHSNYIQETWSTHDCH